MAKAKVRVKAGSRWVVKQPRYSEQEFARLGTGHLSYIRQMTAKEVRRRYPKMRIKGMPRVGTLYALHMADGNLIAITDCLDTVLIRAADHDLAIASLH